MWMIQISFPRAYLNRCIAVFILAAAMLPVTQAQTDVIPSSVDMRLVQGDSTDQLLLQLKIHSTDNFGGVLSAITVTIRYDPTSGASLGPSTSFCDFWSPFPPSPPALNAGVAYCTFNGFGFNRLENSAANGGCATALVPEQWFTVTTILVVGSCTAFTLGNDAWTGANNRDYYLSMNGNDVTGAIIGGPVTAGTCVVDCLGVTGGTALPGTMCDDNDPNTTGDMWSAACVCAGNPICEPPVITSTLDNSPSCSTTGLLLGVSATGTGPLSYSWSGVGSFDPDPTAQNVTVTEATTGTYHILVGNACGQDSANITVDITAAPDASIAYEGSPYCNNVDTAEVTLTGSIGGIYDASPSGLSLSVVTGAIDLGASVPGSYSVTYNISANGGCEAFSNTAMVQINEVVTWYADQDSDGVGDATDSTMACEQPTGYVAISGDLCPNDPNKLAPGACGCGIPDTDTDGDEIPDCIDSCPYLAGAVGDTCDDGDASTFNDVITADCVCAGTLYDCPGIMANFGDSCDDGNANTIDDIITMECICQGSPSTGLMEACDAGVSIELFPNPSRTGMVNLRIKGLPLNAAHVVIVVLDAAGHQVHSETAQANGGTLFQPMDLASKLSQGLYMVEIIVDEHRYLQQLMIQ